MILSFRELQEAGYYPRTSLIKRPRLGDDGKQVVDEATKIPQTVDSLETQIVNDKGFPLKHDGKPVVGYGATRDESQQDAINKAATVLGISVSTKPEVELLRERIAALEAKVSAGSSVSTQPVVNVLAPPATPDDLGPDDEDDDFPFDEGEDEELDEDED